MRTLTQGNIGQLTSTYIRPVFFVSLSFLNGTTYACTAPFSVTWGGNTYLGVGQLGSIGHISETSELVATGTTLTLDGIDNAILAESLNDVGSLLPAAIYLGFLDENMALIDTPMKLFGGVVDAPSVSIGTETSSVTISLVNRLANLSRGPQRRYDSEDQKKFYPDDTAFFQVPQLNDLSLKFGAN